MLIESLESRLLLASDFQNPRDAFDVNDDHGSGVIFVSADKHGQAAAIPFDREDILSFDIDSQSWSMEFDGSDVGLQNADVNAFHFLSDNEVLMAIDRSGQVDLPGLGRLHVDPSDILKFTATSFGFQTAGTFEVYFDGSDVGLGNGPEAISAIAFTPEGDLVISTFGAFKVNDGTLRGEAEDLIVFEATKLGDETTGTFQTYFDGSDVGLSSSKEEIWGTWIDSSNGEMYLSTRDTFWARCISGDGLDVISFLPTSLGKSTDGVFGDAIFFDGSASGLSHSWNSFDGIYLKFSGGMPVLSPIDDRTIDEETELSFTAMVNASGGSDALTFSLDANSPAGAQIDPITGLFRWTPTEDQGPGVFELSVVLSSSAVPIDRKAFVVTVGEVNRRPALSPIGNQTTDEQAELTFTAVSTDLDAPANSLRFRLDNGAPDGASIDAVTGLFQWTPTERQGPGDFDITVRVTDDGVPALDAFETIRVTVGEVNRAPVMGPIDDLFVETFQQGELQVTASDPDLPLNQLTFSLDPGAPNAATIDALTGVLRWTPVSPQTFDVTVRVVDDGSPQRNDSKTITLGGIGCPFDTSLWSESETGGSMAEHGTAGGGICVSSMTEGDSFGVTLERTIQIPDDRTVIEFSLADLAFDSGDTAGINDAFEAAIVDTQGNSLVHTFAPDRDAFFNVTEGQAAQTAAGVTFDGQNVTVDLSGVAAGTQATFLFRLVNNDTDKLTSVNLTRFDVLAGIGQGTQSVIIQRPDFVGTGDLDLSALSDVTASIEMEFATSSYDQLASTLFTDVSLYNAGQFVIDAPMLLAIENISDPTVRAIDFDGRTPGGSPYFEFSSLIESGMLDPLESSATRSIAFRNPGGIPFTFTPIVLAQLNRAPSFTTEPDTEAIVDKPYTYDVDANDPDGDTLRFSLALAPAGMQIDADTGIIHWGPTAADIGNHSITVQVDDGRGELTDQSFTLSAISPPPNRPPVFASVPVVGANVSTPYTYAVEADDSDSDPLTFSIESGPLGLAIDEQSGVIMWEPGGMQSGQHDVSVLVDDGRGGVATQEFRISVGLNSDNQLPLFVSDPPTQLNLPGETNPASGVAAPTSIGIEVSATQTYSQTVSVTLPEESVEQFADIVFIVDETNLMSPEPALGDGFTNSRQGWIGDAATQLDAALQSQGIGPNQFGLYGFGSWSFVATNPVQVGQIASIEAFSTLEFGAITGAVESDVDVDHDGDIDIIVRVIGSASGVVVFLNDGNGNFSSGVVYGVGAPSFGNVSAEDLDGDGNVDLVSSGLSVYVLLGNGDGTFQDSVSYSAPRIVSGNHAIGDVNGDGVLDVVVSDRYYSIIYTYLGDGDGGLSFLSEASIQGGTLLGSPRYVALGDLDGDGILDVVSSDSVLFGIGDGEFGNEIKIDGGIAALVDVNEDQALDIAYGRDSRFLLNDGNGGFTVGPGYASAPTVPYTQSNGFTPAQFSDLNGDGHTDVVQTTDFGVAVFLGAGDGTFPHRSDYMLASASGRLTQASLADIDGDAHSDLVLYDSTKVVVVRGLGDGTFDGPVTRYGPLSIRATKTADMNGDAHIDIVAITEPNGGFDESSLAIFYGDGQGGISSRSEYPISPASVLALADLDGDGDVDVVIDRDHVNFEIFLNDGTGSLSSDEVLISGSFSWIRSLQPADLNQDGRMDLVIGRQGATTLFYGIESGTLDPTGIPIPIVGGGTYYSDQAVVDFNEDGILDIASVAGSREVYVRFGNAEGGFEAGPSNPTFYPVNYLVTGDIDGDGDVDMVATANAQLNVFLNDGSGFFVLSTSSIPGGNYSHPTDLVDLNADSFADLVVVVTELHKEKTVVLFGDGRGSFGPRNDYDFVRSPGDVTVSDLNADGFPDIVAGSTRSESLSIVLNNGYGDFGRFGTAEQLKNARYTLSRTGSPTSDPDGYSGIEGALNYQGRPGATTYFVLVTANDRQVVDSSLGFASIRDALQNRGVVLDVVVDGNFSSEGDVSALGVNGLGQAVVPDGAGGYQLLPGGAFDSGVGKDDYVDLAWSLGGTAWDLDLLRVDTQQTATQAFVDRSVAALQQGVSLDVIASDSSISFENLTGVVDNLRPGETANFEIRITGDGLAHGFDLLFVPEDTGNLIGSIPVVVNTQYVYDTHAIDPDGDPLTYSLAEAPEGAVIDPDSGMVRWRPTVAGAYPFRVEVVDPGGGSAVQEFTVEVTSGIPNSTPHVELPNVPNAVVDDAFQLAIEASDSDLDRLSYYVTQGPDGLSIDRLTGVIGWMPTALQLGPNDVTVNVLDGRGGSESVSFSIVVLPEIFNHSPRINSTPDNTAHVSQPFIYHGHATDEDGDTLTWKLAVGPAGMYVEAETGTLVWTPTVYQSAPADVILRVRDGKGGLDLQRFQIELERPNTPPVILSTPASQAVAGLPHHYWVRAQDAENDDLTFSLLSPPSAASIDSATGLIEWTPTMSQIGQHEILVSVDDGQGHEVRRDIAFDVVADAANTPPQFLPTPDLFPRKTVEFRYQLEAIDFDGDPLAFDLVAGPQGMTVSSTGLLKWRPPTDDSGTHPVTLRVQDGRGGTGLLEIMATSASATNNRTPIILPAPPATAIANQIFGHDFKAFDPDGDPILWDLRSGPIGMSLDPNNGTLRWFPKLDQLGDHVIRVAAYDGQPTFGLEIQTFQITVRATNTPPVITSVPPTLGSVGTVLRYQVNATDIDGDMLEFTKSGPANMTIDPTTGFFEWTPTAGQVGTHAITIGASDGQGVADQSFSIVVAPFAPNLPPNITSTPGLHATIDEPYQYDVDAVDPEGQLVTYQLLDAPTDMAIDNVSGRIDWTPTALGQTTVSVVASDALGGGAIQRYTLGVLATNNEPTIDSLPIESVATGGQYRYDVRANDVDDDPLTFVLVGQPIGMTIDARLGQIRWSPGIAGGLYPFDIHVSDGRGGVAAQSVNLNVGLDQLGPQIQIKLDPNPIDLGDRVTILVTAVDDVAVTSLALSVDGVVVPLDSSGRATIVAQTVGQSSVVATATDPSGNIGQSTSGLLVRDPSDADAPVLAITSPEANGQITGPVDVIGTVTDATLVSYTLSYASLDGGTFVEIASGSSPVTDGVLGTLDPTVLANDTYILQLSARDAGGHKSTEQILVDVTGDLKIGNFTLAFTDLSIPVSGIPITLARTYDSLNAAIESDFSHGWRMEFADTDVRTSVAKTGAEEDLIYNPFYHGARVYVTLPGGKREGFTFRMTPAPGYAGSILGIFAGTFVPDADVTSTLTPAREFSLRVTEFGEALDFNTGLPWNPFSPTFGGTLTVTTLEGIRYTIDGDTGDLAQVADRNGNTLTFSDAGISSSSGQSVTFERDPQGRISAIIDPAGNRVSYAYDGNGDLISVTDREGNVTQLRYEEPTRPHFLTEIIDPLGRSGIRSEYDDSGRLIHIIDAGEEAVQLIHDPDNFVETVKNQLRNPTTYEYDSLGNVVTEIDAEGGVTRYTYDDPNNRLKETSITDPLGDVMFFQYDGKGKVLTETDPLGNVTLSTYDSFGNLLTSTDPLGNTWTNRYDSRGNLLSITDAGGLATRFTYDTSGNPVTLELPGGNTQTFVYDSVGNVLAQTDALGSVTTFTYDSLGNQLTETRTQSTPTGTRTIVTEREYDADSRVRFSRFFEDGVLQSETETRYDAVGNRIETIDALGRSTRFVHDDRGLLIETILPDTTPADDSDNPRTSSEYDAAGQTVATIDELGRRIEFRYDKTGRQTDTIFPDDTPADLADNPRTTTEYDAAGRVIAQIDERGNRTQFVFNNAGQQVEVILADATPEDLTDNPRLLTAYDNAGRSVAQTDPLGHVMRFVYDDVGRPVETIFQGGSSVQSIFDDAGRPIQRIDQAGLATQYAYDPLGRLTAVILPEVDEPVSAARIQPRTGYEYDELGNMIVQRDANGHETHFEYDGQGRRTATVLPLGQRSTTTYDAVGAVRSTTDFNGDTIAFTYDVLGRLTLKDLPGAFPDVAYTYTLTGQRETVTDGRGTTEFEYDQRDHLVSRTDPDLANIAYTYDAASNRTSVTTAISSNPPRETLYTFDEQNRMSTVTDPEGDITEYSYDLASRLVRTDLPNNTFEARSYDELNRLTLLQSRNALTDEVLTSFAYELDAAGNRTTVTEHDGRRVEYDYDELYRLTNETIFDPGAPVPSRTIDYIYDVVGNRQTRDDSAEGVTGYTYDDNDRLLTETLAGDETRYTYDENGNTIAKENATDSVFYSWDGENRLIAADTDGDGSDDVSYQYDADGIRVSRTSNGDETRFLVDKNRPYAQVLEEYTSGGIIKVSYVHGMDLISQNRDQDTGKSFFHVDGLGSTRALSNSSGLVKDSYIYEAFGRTIGQVGSTENAYLFAGEQRDLSIGLDYLRARYLDAGSGRFVSLDGFEGLIGDPVTLHEYLYGNVNPVLNTDPSGETSIFDVYVGVVAISFLSTILLAKLDLIGGDDGRNNDDAASENPFGDDFVGPTRMIDRLAERHRQRSHGRGPDWLTRAIRASVEESRRTYEVYCKSLPAGTCRSSGGGVRG